MEDIQGTTGIQTQCLLSASQMLLPTEPLDPWQRSESVCLSLSAPNGCKFTTSGVGMASLSASGSRQWLHPWMGFQECWDPLDVCNFVSSWESVLWCTSYVRLKKKPTRSVAGCGRVTAVWTSSWPDRERERKS